MPDNQQNRRASWAVAAVFAAHGALSGSFATRIPWISEHLALGPGLLGLALVWQPRPRSGGSPNSPRSARRSAS